MTNIARLITRVINEGIVDTQKYRYASRYNNAGGLDIIRIPLDLLETTAALNNDNWEIVVTLLA